MTGIELLDLGSGRRNVGHWFVEKLGRMRYSGTWRWCDYRLCHFNIATFVEWHFDVALGVNEYFSNKVTMTHHCLSHLEHQNYHLRVGQPPQQSRDPRVRKFQPDLLLELRLVVLRRGDLFVRVVPEIECDLLLRRCHL